MEGLITLGKDIFNRLEKSGVIYKLICKRCKVTYVGQTGRLLNTRVRMSSAIVIYKLLQVFNNSLYAIVRYNASKILRWPSLKSQPF